MKILIDFRKYDGVVGGVELGVIQVAQLLAQRGHRIVLLPKENRLKEVKDLCEGHEGILFVPLPVSTHAMCRENARLDAALIQDLASRHGAQVIHFPYNWSFPTRKKAPTVLTVHDVIPLTFREAMGLFTNLFRYKPGMKKACRLNDAIATVSEFSKREIIEKLGVPPEKIRVIPNGLRAPHPSSAARRKAVTERLALKGRFILNVGGIHERKNIPRLIEAFAHLVREESYGGSLVVTGSASGAPYQEKMRRRCERVVRKEGMTGRVMFTGFISEEDLDTLFGLADLLIYPSLYEGFGIPVLEAMNVGLPVITSDRTALPETAGSAALLVDPYSVSAMKEAMARLLRDGELRNELIQKGKERAAAFSWERTAEQYLKLYAELAQTGPGASS